MTHALAFLAGMFFGVAALILLAVNLCPLTEGDATDKRRRK